MPLFPVYLSERGVTASGFAFISAVQALTALILAQPIGYLADAWMSRTRMFMLMCLGGAFVAAIYPLLPTSLFWLSLGMAGLSIFLSQRTSVFNALILDSRDGERLYPPIRMMGSLGFVLVTPIIGWMADIPMFGVAIIWPAVVAIELILVLVIIGLVDASPAVRLGKSAGRISFRMVQRLLFGNRLILHFLLFVFLTQSVAVPGHIFQAMLLKELGTTALFITLALTWAASLELIVFWWGTEIVKRFGVMNLFALIPVAMAVRFGMIFLSPTPVVIFASNTLHFITFGLAYLCGVIFINREIPRELKSSGQTLFGLVFMMVSSLIGNLMAFALMHWAATRLAMPDVAILRMWYGGAALFMTLALWAYLPFRREYRRRHFGRG